MNFEKRIDSDSKKDIYVLYITHEEADRAFEIMTDAERTLILELQKSQRISDLLKMLEVWTRKIEESRSRTARVRPDKRYDG